MDPSNDIAMADLSLNDQGRDLWDAVLPHLWRALSGEEEFFLEALEAAGRGAGLAQTVPVEALLNAYLSGSEQVRQHVISRGGANAEADARRLLALEHTALARTAAGYASGQQEIIDRLRRLVDDSSPVDPDSGAIKPSQLSERLSLEVERCQRMDLSLGLVELVVEAGEKGIAASVRHASPLQQVGACLRDSLRRYDSVGLTEDGAFVLVLPDVSRRGLVGAAERLRHRLSACAGQGPAPELTFALAHYELVDVSSSEMLAALDRGLQSALADDRPLDWV